MPLESGLGSDSVGKTGYNGRYALAEDSVGAVGNGQACPGDG